MLKCPHKKWDGHAYAPVVCAARQDTLKGEGTVMNWKNKPFWNKVVEVVMLLSVIAYFALTSMKSKGILEVHASVPRLCFSVVWLCLGITFWKSSKALAVIQFVLAAVWLGLAIFFLF